MDSPRLTLGMLEELRGQRVRTMKPDTRLASMEYLSRIRPFVVLGVLGSEYRICRAKVRLDHTDRFSLRLRGC